MDKRLDGYRSPHQRMDGYRHEKMEWMLSGFSQCMDAGVDGWGLEQYNKMMDVRTEEWMDGYRKSAWLGT